MHDGSRLTDMRASEVPPAGEGIPAPPEASLIVPRCVPKLPDMG
jgi:hypothetical protein